VLVVAHRLELIDQISNQLVALGREHSVLLQKDPRFVEGHALQVASIGTLVRRPKELARKYDLLVIDEAHHTAASTYRTIIGMAPHVIGATATPYRLDGRPLGHYYERIIVAAHVHELVAQGYLAKPRQYVRAAPELSGVPLDSDGDYVKNKLAEKMMKPEIVAQVIQQWALNAANRRSIAYSVNIEHGEVLRQAFLAQGATAALITGETPDDLRRQLVQDFRSGALQVLVNCMVFVEGLDVPECDAIVLARPTKSRSLWRQMCGRGLRVATGKTDCVLLDHGNLYRCHGSVLAQDIVSLDASVKAKSEKRQCPQCKEWIDRLEEQCPFCDTTIQKLDDDEEPLGPMPGPEFVIAAGAMVCIDEPDALYAALARAAFARAAKDREPHRAASRLRHEFRRLVGRFPSDADQQQASAELKTAVVHGRPVWVALLEQKTLGDPG
jgi:superfamily II DNA or RNA helicase